MIMSPVRGKSFGECKVEAHIYPYTDIVLVYAIRETSQWSYGPLSPFPPISTPFTTKTTSIHKLWLLQHSHTTLPALLAVTKERARSARVSSSTTSLSIQQKETP